jgi:hypothetical protein
MVSIDSPKLPRNASHMSIMDPNKMICELGKKMQLKVAAVFEKRTAFLINQ